MNYLVHLLVTIGIYMILAQSSNLVIGYAGLLSLGQAAFYGLGAYTSALLMVDAGWSFLPAAAAGAALTAAVALVVGLSCARLRGDPFVLAILGFQMITFTILYNWEELTRGSYGIAGIPRPSIAGWTLSSPFSFLAFVAAAAGLSALLHWWIVHLPYGRTLQAVRDDEIASRSLGKNTAAIRAAAFVIAAALAAVVGAVYAAYVQYIDPTSFGLEESIFILAMIIVGGAGTLRGPVIGAVALVMLPELLRMLRVPDTVAPNVRQIIYGLLLIALMRLRPQGLMGRYAFD